MKSLLVGSLCGAVVLAWSLAGAQPLEIAVTGRKLIVKDKIAASGIARVVYVSTDGVAGITKGSGMDPGAIDAQFDYVVGAEAGQLVVPIGATPSANFPGWWMNGTLAKFHNPLAPNGGGTDTHIAKIKPATSLKIVAYSLGDTPIDLFAVDVQSYPVYTAYLVNNGGFAAKHCTVFLIGSCVLKPIAGGRAGSSSARAASVIPPASPPRSARLDPSIPGGRERRTGSHPPDPFSRRGYRQHKGPYQTSSPPEDDGTVSRAPS